MRSKAWREVVERSGHAAHVLLLYFAHARSSSTGKLRSWVPLRRLADLTGAWRKTVYESLTILKERGWLTEQRSRGAGRGDEYTLVFPGDAGEVHAQVLARLTKKDGPAVESALFQDGDVFFYNGAWHIREARVPLSALSSWIWTELRRASPLAMHLYLLLVGYGQDGKLGGTRLAREARVHKSRVPEAIALLRELAFIHVTPDWQGKKRKIDLYTILPLDSPPARSPELEVGAAPPARPAPSETCDHCGQAMHTSVAPVAEVEGLTPPPTDLVALLEAQIPEASRHYPPAKIWEFLRAYDLWPRREERPVQSLDEIAQQIVTVFHAEGRGAEGYVPTRNEVALALELCYRYGPGERSYVWFVVRNALRRMERTKFIPGHFGAIRRYLAEIEAAYPEVVFDASAPRPDPSG